MSESAQHYAGTPVQSSASSRPTHTTRHPLSCTHCRQRKIKCDKVHPCAPCQRSNYECIFPERVRHTKKRKTPKTTNDELLRRLGRMEELIEEMKSEGRESNGSSVAGDRGSRSPSTPQIRRERSEDSRSHEDGGCGMLGERTKNYIGGAFFRSLAYEVEGLKQTMDDDTSDDEDAPGPGHTSLNTYSSQTTTLFGSSPIPPRELRLLHPTPNNMSTLCEFYIENCDPMAKFLHTPSLRKLVAHASADVHAIPTDNYVEALLFALYYAAVTSLTEGECFHWFQEGREHLLIRYRMGTETALANADLLNTTEMGTLQALLVFLISARSNNHTQFVWTMTGVAVRLGQALGLHHENSRPNLSSFQTEMRRRLWWQIIQLDVRCTEDRGTDPLVLDNSFNTKRPLNINDSDMDPQSMEPIVERQGFTEMTKSHVSDMFWASAIRMFALPLKETEENLPPAYQAPLVSFDEKLAIVSLLEKRFESQILPCCDPANPLAWVTSVVVRLVMARFRLAIYHPPMYDDRCTAHQTVSRETVLTTAVQMLEYTHLLDTNPAAAKWRWFFKTHVQWHALAATLAELCVQDQGPLVERAWMAVDAVFDNWAACIADSRNGMLWRPIKKLMCKAQAKRNESQASNLGTVYQQQQPLPQFQPFNQLQDPTSTIIPYHPNSVLGMAQKYNLEAGLSTDIMSSLNVSEPEGAINWAQWDEFMQDFQMKDPGPMNPNAIQQDASYLGDWW